MVQLEGKEEEKEDRGVFSNWDQNAAASAPAPRTAQPLLPIQCKVEILQNCNKTLKVFL